MEVAGELYRLLQERGVETILDDREERPGIKFKDSELVGFPLRVTVGEKSLARDEVEIKPRNGNLWSVKTGEAIPRIVAWLDEQKSAAR